MHFVNFTTRVAVIVLVVALTGACATGQQLAKAAMPAQSQNLIDGAMACSKIQDQASRDACLLGPVLASKTAIEIANAASRTDQYVLPPCPPWLQTIGSAYCR
jgi:hypothetical protein